MVSDLVKVHASYRGYGEPLIGFWPYFLHEYSSAGISEAFELTAGTLIVLFTLYFLIDKEKVGFSEFSELKFTKLIGFVE